MKNIVTLIKREKNIIFFLRIDWSLFLKLESLLPKDALCQVWLKLADQFWRRRFLKKFINIFSLLSNLE